MPAIDWEKIRDVSDVIVPDPFPAHDRDGIPTKGAQPLYTIPFGTRVRDRAGSRFLVMGYGSVQGTVILRDRYRRMFHADSSMHMAVVGPWAAF